MLYQQICTQEVNNRLKKRLEVNYFERLSMQFEFTNNQVPLHFGSGDRAQGHVDGGCPILLGVDTSASAGLTHVWAGCEVF